MRVAVIWVRRCGTVGVPFAVGASAWADRPHSTPLARVPCRLLHAPVHSRGVVPGANAPIPQGAQPAAVAGVILLGEPTSRVGFCHAKVGVYGARGDGGNVECRVTAGCVGAGFGGLAHLAALACGSGTSLCMLSC